MLRPLLRQTRSIHSSSVRSDLFDFFRRKKISETGTSSATPQAVQKTKDVMKKLESDGSTPAATEGDKDIGQIKKLRMLGVPEKVDLWATRDQALFMFNAWPLQLTNASLTTEQVEQALLSVYSDKASWTTNMTSVNEKFEFVKSISQQLKVTIPDPVVSQLNNVEEFYSYLSTKVAGREYDERQPDAVYLKAQDFEGTNISVRDAVSERYARKQKFRDALREAKAEQKRSQDELIRQSLE